MSSYKELTAQLLPCEEGQGRGIPIPDCWDRGEPPCTVCELRPAVVEALEDAESKGAARNKSTRKDREVPHKILLQQAEKYPDRLNIMFEDGGSLSPAVGRSFWATREGMVVEDAVGLVTHSWDNIREIYIPRPKR